jgi:hypothetical protein
MALTATEVKKTVAVFFIVSFFYKDELSGSKVASAEQNMPALPEASP